MPASQGPCWPFDGSIVVTGVMLGGGGAAPVDAGSGVWPAPRSEAPIPRLPSCGARARPKNAATENALVIEWWRSKTSPSTSHCEAASRDRHLGLLNRGEKVAPPVVPRAADPVWFASSVHRR